MPLFAIVRFCGLHDLACSDHLFWLGSRLFGAHGFPDFRGGRENDCRIRSPVNIGPGKLISANAHQITALEGSPLNALVIHKGAIRAIQVTDDEVVVFQFQARVLPGNARPRRAALA